MIALLLLLLLVSCSMETPSRPQKVNIVSIGITYQDTDANPLYGTVNDAKELLLAFQERYAQCHTTLLTDAQAGKAQVTDVISSIPKSDLSIIIYSGHGMKDGSWVLHDPDCKQFDDKGEVKRENLLLPTELWALLSKRSEPVLVISDSCYSGNLLPDSGSVSSPNEKDSEVTIKSSATLRFALACTTRDNTGKENSRQVHAHGYFSKALLDTLGWNEARQCVENQECALSLDELYEGVVSRQKLPISGNKRRSQHPVVSAGCWDLWL